MTAAAIAPPDTTLAHWLLAQEARGLLTRLDRVRPFVLEETMVPAAAPMPAAQVAIDGYLMAGRRKLRRTVLAYLAWLRGEGRAAPGPVLQRRFTVLKLGFNAALSQLDVFAEAINQRSTHQTGVWLGGLDIAAQDALTLPGQFFQAPPIVCYLHRGLGGAIRRARTRLPGGGASPVALIRIPRERMIGYGIASSLVHEVGHQGAALLGLVASLQRELRAAEARLAAPLRPAWKLLTGWISEVVADLWALGKIGIASTLGLIGIVSLPRVFVFRVDPEDPHPFPWIRVLLSCAIGDALYPHRQWSQLAATWERLYPVQGLDPERAELVRRLRTLLPAFARALVDHRPASLRGRSLGEVLRVPGRDPDHLAALAEAWHRQPAQLFQAPPTLVFAVLGRARAAGRISPELESERLGTVITHWAVQGTLDLLGGCRHRWAAAGARCGCAVHGSGRQELEVG